MKKIYIFILMFCALGSLSAFAQQQQTITWEGWPSELAGSQDITITNAEADNLPNWPKMTDQGVAITYSAYSVMDGVILEGPSAEVLEDEELNLRLKIYYVWDVTIVMEAAATEQYSAFKQEKVIHITESTYKVDTEHFEYAIVHIGEDKKYPTVKVPVIDNAGHVIEGGFWENKTSSGIATTIETLVNQTLRYTAPNSTYSPPYIDIIVDVVIDNKPIVDLGIAGASETVEGKDWKTIDTWPIEVSTDVEDDAMPVTWTMEGNPVDMAITKVDDPNTILFNKAGTLTITVNQVGANIDINGTSYQYEDAIPVSKTITVRKTKLSGTLDQAGQNVQLARGSALSTIALTGSVIDEEGNAVTDGHWEFVDPTIVPTANGSYKVKYVVGNTDKYESTIAEQTVNVIIEPMDLHGGELVETAFTLLEGQSLEDITLAIQTNPQDEQNQSVAGTVAFPADAPSLQLGKNSYDVIFTPAANADWYNLPYKFPTQVTITVNKPVQTITWEGTETIRTIDEDKISATSNQGAAISYSADAAFLKIEGGAIMDILKAGTVTVTATAAEIKVGKVTYPSITATKTFTINKTDIDHIDDLGTLSYTYGETLASKNITTNGYTPAPQETVVGTIVFDEPNAVPQAGESTANATFTPTESEKFNTYKTTVNIIVGKAVQTVVGMPVSVLTAERFVLPEKTEQGAVLSYTSSDISVVEINADRSLNIHQAGTATITATAPVTADGNYAEFNQPYSLEVKLTPASIENIVATEIHADDTWGTTTVTGTLVASVPDKGINISQNLTGEFYAYGAAGKDDTPGTPGDYIIQVDFTITPDNYFDVVDKPSADIHVKGTHQVITWTPVETSIRTIDKITATAPAGAVEYTLSDNTAGATVVEGAIQFEKDGQVTITATNVGNAEYAPVQDVKTYTIRKTNVTASYLMSTNTLEYGQKLSEITITNTESKDEANNPVEGSWTIDEDVNQILSVGTHQITLLFTPTNTNWYNTYSKDVEVTITKSTQTIEWTIPEEVYTVQTIMLPKTSSAGNAITYTFTDDADTPLAADNVIAIFDDFDYSLVFKQAGAIKIIANVAGDNHEAIVDESHPLQIKLTPIDIKNVSATPLYQGEAWKTTTITGTIYDTENIGFSKEVIATSISAYRADYKDAWTYLGNDNQIPEYLGYEQQFFLICSFELEANMYNQEEIVNYGWKYPTQRCYITVYPFTPSDIVSVFPNKSDVTVVDQNATYRQLLYFDVNTTVTGADKTHANLIQPVSVTDEQYFFKSSKAKEWMMFTPPFDISEIYVIDVTGDNATALYNHLVDEVAKVPASQTEEGTTAATTLDVLNLIKTQTNNELYPITSVDHFLLYESADTWAYKGGDALEASWTRVKDSKMQQGKVYSMFFPLEYFNDKLLLFVGKNWTQIGTSLQNETAATAAASVRGNSTLKNQELGGNEWVYKATYTPTEGGETLTSVFYAHKVTADDDAIISPSEVYLVPQDIQKARTGGEMYAPRRVQSDSHYLQAVGVTREGTLIWEPMENESTTDIENITGATLSLITETAGFSIISATTQEVVIYSTTGRLVFQGTIDAELRTHFPVPAGIYIVKTPKETHKVIAK